MSCDMHVTPYGGHVMLCDSFSCFTGHLGTVPFDEKAFENEMMVSQDFEHSALVPLATLGQPVCQELYRDVAMIRSWASRKNGRNQSV